MLTFEKVLKVFQAYLDDDPLYEVVQTSHGYTLMAWEPHRNDWYSAEIQKTPEIMREESEQRQRVSHKLKLCPEEYLPIIEGAIDGAMKIEQPKKKETVDA